MRAPWFVDVHSHVVPSGDDGAQSIEDGIELCRLAVAGGTRVLFATPHVHAAWDSYPWSAERARLYERCFPPVQEAAAALGLELRRGYELFPSEVPSRGIAAFGLEGTDAVLIEYPGSWIEVDDELTLVRDAARRALAEGLVPVLAHPERCRSVAHDPGAVEALVAQGALLCVNAGSLVGDHGAAAERAGWQLVEAGLVALAASDGHRVLRPPTMDAAHAAVANRLGPAAAAALFDGSALPWHAGAGAPERPSQAPTRGATR